MPCVLTQMIEPHINSIYEEGEQITVEWEDNGQCTQNYVQRIDLYKNSSPYINNLWNGLAPINNGSMTLELPESIDTYGDIYQLRLHYGFIPE